MQTFGRRVAAVATLLHTRWRHSRGAGCISASYGLGSQGRDGRPPFPPPSNHPLETYDALDKNTGTRRGESVRNSILPSHEAKFTLKLVLHCGHRTQNQCSFVLQVTVSACPPVALVVRISSSHRCTRRCPVQRGIQHEWECLFIPLSPLPFNIPLLRVVFVLFFSRLSVRDRR